MRESATQQTILAEGEAGGKAQEAVRNLPRPGRKRFGDPPPEAVAAVEATGDLDRIEVLTDGVLDVSSRDELFEDSEPDHSRWRPARIAAPSAKIEWLNSAAVVWRCR